MNMENNGKTEPSFEEKMRTLEKLISTLESGTLSLDKSVEAYEQGAKILDEMEKELESAEQRLTVITSGREEKLELEKQEM